MLCSHQILCSRTSEPTKHANPLKQNEDRKKERMLTLEGFHYISQICSRAKKVFNIVATERNRRVTLDGDQALNGKSQTSEWNTKTAPKAPVYIAELIRLCGADMFPPHDNELPCCVPYLPGPNTNRTLTCLYCHQQSKYWKR